MAQSTWHADGDPDDDYRVPTLKVLDDTGSGGGGWGGGAVEGGAGRGDAVTEAAQAGAQAQHQAGRATRLKYRERGLVNRKWKITQLLCCDLRGVWQ